MQRRLFGNPKYEKRELDMFERFILESQRDTFIEKAARLRYTDGIYPHELFMMTDNESALLLNEARFSFVDGHFISTIMLAQAFIDRRFQLYLEAHGRYKDAKGSMEQKIVYFRRFEVMPSFILDQIDLLRKKRNPFAHLKPVEHEFNMTWRTMDAVRKNDYGDPRYLLLKDAKTALSLMYFVAESIGGYVDMARLAPPRD